MKRSAKIGYLVATALVAASGAAFAQASAPIMANPTNNPKAVVPYVQSPNGQVVVDPFGLCWRTGFWTLALAEAGGIDGPGCKCDKALLPKAVCEPPPPPPPPKPVPPPPPPPPPAPTSEKITFAADTLFAFDKADLRPEGKQVLDDLVSKMAGVNLEVIIAVGYTDRIGPLAHNMKLSQRRAATVKDYLVSKGIEPNRIYTEGKGPANPVKECPNPSPKGEIKTFKQLVECLQPNRRTEVEVVGTRTIRR